MSRGGRVPRPAAKRDWELRFAKKQAANDWDALCQQAPGNCARAHDLLREGPRAHSDRNHPLKGSLAHGTHRGRQLDRWQNEVTSGARVWFLIDDEKRTVWFEVVHIGHPKETD